MKILGITKVRNEAEIIRDTLDHWGRICTGGIYVYDDVSEDDTADICQRHPAVKTVIRGREWDPERERAEWTCRQQALEAAKKDALDHDWFAYFDADERLYLKDRILFYADEVKAVACKLFDVHITPEDVNKHYTERNWVAPGYRRIIFFFKNSPYLAFQHPDQREVTLEPHAKVVTAGIVKHYGKGLSVRHWEETCDYYIRHFPRYAEKWRQRKGRAIKYDYVSDFGNKLVKFSQVLTGEVEGILGG